jgi:tRNA A-37 threonylcarbamoyl transferase component Bud32
LQPTRIPVDRAHELPANLRNAIARNKLFEQKYAKNMDFNRARNKLSRVFRPEKMVVARDWEKVMRANKLDSLAALYSRADGKIATRSGTTEVRRLTLVFEGTERPVYLKKYWANTFSQLWSGALRGTFFGISKARREFENLARLRSWGLDAPAPVAYGEERKFGWMTRSFLVSEEIPQPMSLGAFIRDVLSQMPDEERRKKKRELIQHLARTTRRLHEHRFAHHDLFWRNIILSGLNLEHFFLIDAHKGNTSLPWNEFRRRAHDLAALDSPAAFFFSRTERLRFFLAYLQEPRLNQKNKKLLRRVLSIAAPMRSQQLRRVQNAGRTH